MTATGVIYTFAGAYAIDLLADAFIPEKIRRPAKAGAIALWSRHTWQGRLSEHLGKAMLKPVGHAAKGMATHPALWMGIGIVAQTNIQYHMQPKLPDHSFNVLHDQRGPRRYGVGMPYRPVMISEDNPLLISNWF